MNYFSNKNIKKIKFTNTRIILYKIICKNIMKYLIVQYI